MHRKFPKIIFVDGFNTVGKDHFIKELQAALPGPSIVTDPRVWLPVFQQNKRYWDFVYRSTEENESILRAHLQHLRSLLGKINEPFTSNVTLIANRSFVSALNYNYLPSSFNGRDIGGDDEFRNSMLRLYKGIFHAEFADVTTLMVNLHHFHTDLSAKNTPAQNIAEVRRRMHERDPEVLMNDYYLEYLIHAYQNPAQEVKDLYTHWRNYSSSDAECVVAEFFTAQVVE